MEWFFWYPEVGVQRCAELEWFAVLVTHTQLRAQCIASKTDLKGEEKVSSPPSIVTRSLIPLLLSHEFLGGFFRFFFLSFLEKQMTGLQMGLCVVF